MHTVLQTFSFHTQHYQCFHSFIQQYLLFDYYVPGTVQSSWDVLVNKNKDPCLHKLYIVSWAPVTFLSRYHSNHFCLAVYLRNIWENVSFFKPCISKTSLVVQNPPFNAGGSGSIPVRELCVCAQSCPTLCNYMDCSPPGFSVHGIFQASILEWIAISFSRGSFWLAKGLNPHLLHLLHWWVDSLPLYHLGTKIPHITRVLSSCATTKAWHSQTNK